MTVEARLALVGELIHDAAHELNNQLAFVLSNLQNLAEYGEALERVLAAYRERVRAAGLADPQLAALETEVDLDFLLEDAGRAAREGLVGAGRVRDILRIVGRAGDDDGERPVVDLARVVTQVLGVQSKAIALCAGLVRDVGPEGGVVAAPPALLTRALLVMIKHACARLDPAARESNALRVAIERRDGRLVVVVERRGQERDAHGHGLELARDAAATLGAEIVDEAGRTELSLPEAR